MGHKQKELTDGLQGFVSVKGYQKGDGSVADYLINGGVNREAYNERRRTFLVAAAAQLDEVTIDQVLACPDCKAERLGATLRKRHPTDEALAVAMLAQVRDSYLDSIARCDGDERYALEREAPFEYVARGVNRHRETGQLNVFGLLVRKTERQPATKVSSSRADTLVRNWIKRRAARDLDDPYWVSFTLAPDKFDSVTFGGQVVTPVDLAVAA